MAEETNSVGRPALTVEEKADKKRDMLLKMEPYLKAGLSVRKALIQAQITNSEFYKMMNEDENFKEQIEACKQYIPILTSNALVREFTIIIERQKKGEVLSRDDKTFLMWFSLNNNSCREEWGRREKISLEYDPELEIQKVREMIDSSASEEIQHID